MVDEIREMAINPVDQIVDAYPGLEVLDEHASASSSAIKVAERQSVNVQGPEIELPATTENLCKPSNEDLESQKGFLLGTSLAAFAEVFSANVSHSSSLTEHWRNKDMAKKIMTGVLNVRLSFSDSVFLATEPIFYFFRLLHLQWQRGRDLHLTCLNTKLVNRDGWTERKMILRRPLTKL
jgi:hypothetical protein